MSPHLMCLRRPLCWGNNCLHRLLSPGVCCPTALSWLQQEVSPLGRTHGGRVGPRPTAALLGPTHTVSSAWDEANCWMWVNISGETSTPTAPFNMRSNRRLFYCLILVVLLLFLVWLRGSLAKILLAARLTCSLADVSELAVWHNWRLLCCWRLA